MKNVTIEVSGMMCEGCANSVENALKGVSGVKRADVSLEEKRARLSVDDEVAEPDLVTAVENAGYGAKAAGG